MKLPPLLPTALLLCLWGAFPATQDQSQNKAEKPPAAERTTGEKVPLITLDGAPEPSPYHSTVVRPEKPGQDQGTVTIPFTQMQNGLLQIMVELNEKASAPFYFDTGASAITISSRLADRANADVDEGRGVPVSTAGGATICHYAKIRNLRVGNLEMENVKVLVNPAIDTNLFGQNVLSEFNTTIDHDRSVIILTPKGAR